MKNPAAVALGRLGGKAGTGKSKANRANRILWVMGKNGWENKGRPRRVDAKHFGAGVVAKIRPVGVMP